MTQVARAALYTLLSSSIGCGDDSSDATGLGDAGEDASSTETQDPTSSGEGSTTTGVETTTMDDPSEETSSDDGEDTGGGISSALLTIDDQHSPPRLLRVDVDTGAATEICTLALGSAYDSIAFTRDGTLFAHNVARGRIETINPCNCGFQIVGLTGTGSLELAGDPMGGLVALDLALDAFSVVNPSTGLSTIVGPLGVSVSTAGIAWPDDAELPLMLDATTNALYSIDTGSGLGTQIAALSQNLTQAGMDVLEPEGSLFVCAAGILYRVDPTDGAVQTIGALGLVNACHNLAAPPAALACLESRA